MTKNKRSEKLFVQTCFKSNVIFLEIQSGRPFANQTKTKMQEHALRTSANPRSRMGSIRLLQDIAMLGRRPPAVVFMYGDKCTLLVVVLIPAMYAAPPPRRRPHVQSIMRRRRYFLTQRPTCSTASSCDADEYEDRVPLFFASYSPSPRTARDPTIRKSTMGAPEIAISTARMRQGGMRSV